VTTPGPERQQREHETEYDEPTVIRDKRRVDPVTGAVREQGEGSAPGGSAAGGPQGGSAAPPASDSEPDAGGFRPGVDDGAAASEDPETESLRTQLAERTADLQRLQAEYQNYRRRVERDREVVRETATGGVLLELLGVLDDIGRARDHGELDGPFKVVAESLEQAVAKLGLEQYGAPGDAFDPTVHEALMHQHSDDVTEATCVQVLQPGYRLGERVLRPARVAVAEPQGGDAPGEENSGGTPADQE
jgi:molecular chaperone GrpE